MVSLLWLVGVFVTWQELATGEDICEIAWALQIYYYN